jgi:hypothetical protein
MLWAVDYWRPKKLGVCLSAPIIAGVAAPGVTSPMPSRGTECLDGQQTERCGFLYQDTLWGPGVVMHSYNPSTQEVEPSVVLWVSRKLGRCQEPWLRVSYHDL